MSTRRRSAWQWVPLTVLVAALIFCIANLLIGWENARLALVVGAVAFVANVIVFRVFWRRADKRREAAAAAALSGFPAVNELPSERDLDSRSP